MSAITVDEIYNQAKQLSATDQQELFDRLLENAVPEPPNTFHSEDELKLMLRAGIDSGPAMSMTESDWMEIRREVYARAARRSGNSSSNA